ncbi:MAG: type IX secretion system membrane protein PorP/SprF [Prevotella sp.]|nr:type IX secretion system membrane protein PorP/SprF [Prevotella sp.]
MVKKGCIALVLAAMAVLPLRAQYEPEFSHYFDMEPSFNCAAVGKESKLNINAAYNMALVGFEHNPNTMYAAADIPFYFMKAYHGAGLQFMNDNIGVFTHQRIEIQYAAKIKLFGGTLSIGAQLGLLMEGLNGSDVDLEDSSDPAFSTSDQNGYGLDIGAGIYYTRKDFYAGLSAVHLNSPTIELGETNELKIDGTYYFTGGYNIRLRNPFLTIKPSVLVRTDLTSWRGDITARVQYASDKKMMYIGLGYSPTNSVTLFVGGNFHGVVLGYSYEYYTSGLSVANGGHELVLGYQMDINLFKKGRNRHQSVRIL